MPVSWRNRRMSLILRIVNLFLATADLLAQKGKRVAVMQLKQCVRQGSGNIRISILEIQKKVIGLNQNQ